MNFSREERHFRWAFYGGAVMIAAGALLLALPLDDTDPHWRPRIGMKTWNRKHPLIAIDEAHGNSHTAHGRAQPLSMLLMDDGYRVERSTEPLRADALRRIQVLVTINPSSWLGAPFHPEELDAVEQYVRGGGRLLLIAERDAAGGLAARFDFRLSGKFANAELFSALGRHPATKDARCVATNGGQFVEAPGGATALWQSSEGTQAAAMNFGRGRIALLTDASLTTARLPRGGARIGLNNRACDQVRLMRSLFDWLSDGAL